MQKQEILDNTNIEFENRRLELNGEIFEVLKRTVKLEQDKISEKSCQQLIDDVKDSIVNEEKSNEKMRNDLCTLENYVERYVPLDTMKVIRNIIAPLITPEQHRKFEKRCSDFTMDMQENILTDIGRGSIFEQIMKINEDLSQRLKFKVDLQEDLLREPNGPSAGGIDSAYPAVKEKRLNKQDVRDVVVKSMRKIKESLDNEIKQIHVNGVKLQEDINEKSQVMKGQMLGWQKDQEQYKHQLHSELLLLNDTRDNVSKLNNQIRTLILL